MKEEISILGCGWLGMELANHLANKGYIIKGSNRTAANTAKLKAINATPYVFDIADRSQNFSDFLSSQILIIAITSKAVDDFKRLINQIENSTIKKVIFISSTSVYPNTNGIVTEETPTKECALSNIEQLFTSNASFQTTIIRFSGLFGGNRKPGNFLKPTKKTKNPDGYINLIHRKDCIAIIEHVIANKVWNNILNAAADTHPTRRDFYTKEAKKLGNPPPVFDEETPSSYKIVSNQKVKSLLGFQFAYPDLMNL